MNHVSSVTVDGNTVDFSEIDFRKAFGLIGVMIRQIEQITKRRVDSISFNVSEDTFPLQGQISILFDFFSKTFEARDTQTSEQPECESATAWIYAGKVLGEAFLELGQTTGHDASSLSLILPANTKPISGKLTVALEVDLARRQRLRREADFQADA